MSNTGNETAALLARGQALVKSGRLGEAVQAFNQVLARVPDHPDALVALGQVAEKVRDWKAVEAVGRRLMARYPSAAVQEKLGIALLQQERPREALPFLLAARDQLPANAALQFNTGLCRMMLDDFRGAREEFRRALALAPGQRKTLEYLATACLHEGDTGEALAVIEQAIARFPDGNEFRFLRGFCLLRQRRWAEGFDLYRHRWQSMHARAPGHQPRRLDVPCWQGEAFAGRLLVWAEQGLGDELLASSMYADLAHRHPGALVECDARLLPLFRRAFPQLEFVDRASNPFEGATREGDRHLGMLDLGAIFRRSDADFPHRPWLQADPARVQALAASLRARFPGRRLVGLSWQSRHPGIGSAKSVGLETLLPVLRQPDCVFVNLQYGDVSAEIDAFRAQHGISIHSEPFDRYNDIEQLAAQVAVLDLVVSTSNTTVHLAGALGVPCHVLLQLDKGLHWYWPYAGSDCPWYPTLHLHRCPVRGDWATPVAAVAGLLAAGGAAR